MTEHTKPTLREETELAFVEYGLRFEQAEFLSRVASNPLFHAIQREQDRQLAKWGVQDHPSFEITPDWGRVERVESCEEVKEMVDSKVKDGTLAWEDILIEEVAESLAEVTSNEALKTELIQIAAVALSWIESINRQAAAVESQDTINVSDETHNEEQA